MFSVSSTLSNFAEESQPSDESSLSFIDPDQPRSGTQSENRDDIPTIPSSSDQSLESGVSEQSVLGKTTPTSSKFSNKRKKSQVDDELLDMVKANQETRETIVNILGNTKQNTTDDEIDLFYKSIALSVKRLPQQFISMAKMQHLQILTNLEIEAANLQQHNTHTFNNFTQRPNEESQATSHSQQNHQSEDMLNLNMADTQLCSL